jgi:hypothetical protein
MPVLILTIPEYFHKLFENGRLTSIAALSKLCRIVEMTINLAIVFVVAVLRAKYGWAHGAREVIDVVLLIQSRDVRSSERPIALMAYKIQSSEVISFAQRVLAFAILFVDWEELRGYYLPAILKNKTMQSASVA